MKRFSEERSAAEASRMPQTYEVTAEWDEAAGVWIATSDDVPGLCVQAASFDELADTVAALVPELLTLNAAGSPQAC